MKINHVKLMKSFCLFALLAVNSFAQNSASIVEFNVPGMQVTVPQGINESGAIPGFSFTGVPGNSEPFVRNSCGVITPFFVPGSTSETWATVINKEGDVGGFALGPIDAGYVRTSNGAISPLVFPGASENGVNGINDKRDVVGTYYNTTLGSGGAFLKTATGPYQSLSVAGAVSTYASALNNEGVITGYAAFTGNVNRGFVRAQSGLITLFDGSTSSTIPVSINDKGQIAGVSQTIDFGGEEASTGFFRDVDGTLTSFSVPGATYTTPFTIDAGGTIAGSWTDAGGVEHGFFRSPKGIITTLELGIASATTTQVHIYGINTSGEITGQYFDPNGQHAFLRVPFGHADCVTTNGNTSVAFIGVDTRSEGAWMGTYGSAGYIIPAGPSVPANQANISEAQSFTYVWANATSDPRALQTAAGSGIASAFTAYYGQSFSIYIDAYGATPRRVAFYLLDWDTTSRAETITVSDASTGQVYDARSFSGFQNGQYAIWDLKGNFKITVTPTAGPSAAVSGIFVN
jgi:hypothetical protein